MQNRFGLKDFVVVVLLLAVGVSVWLGMVSNDRKWKRFLQQAEKLGTIEQQSIQTDRRVESQARTSAAMFDEVKDRLEAIEARLQAGVLAVTPGEGGGLASDGRTGDRETPRPARGARDTSWARPGVEIAWFTEYGLANDPRNAPGFREGGEFTEIFEAQMVKITAVLAEDTYARRVADLVCESLAEYNSKTLRLEGALAEAWQMDPKGLWLRVKIRDVARFSDGQPVTAEDVRWTFHEYIMNPELETESLRSILGRIEKVEVVSERVVEFTFTQPDAYNMANALGFYVLPKHFYSRFTPSQINQSTGLLMGSGPFRLRELDPSNQWTPGRDVVLVRNEQYWGPRPALAGMRFRSIQDELARLTAYRNGEGDMIMPSSPQFVAVTAESGWNDRNYSLKWVNMRSGYSFIGWQTGPRNGRLTPFHDRRVRLAMTMLLDREAMIRDIWAGIGEVAVGANNVGPARDPSIKPWPFDPDRAKQLLSEAGWRDRNGDGILENERGEPFTFEFTRSSGGQISERIGKFVVDSYARAGIRVTQRAVDWSQFDQILKTRDFDAITMGWSASAPESDLTQIWHTASIERQGHNFIQWRHPDQDRLIEAIRSELDFDRRMKLFHEFGRLLHEEQPYTFVRVPPWLRFIKKDYGNVHTYETGLETREFFRATPERGM